ncbi:MAG TPA: glycine oxidase ThiO [Trebonia sp.]|jgi:glycine oxidase
MDTDILVIGGGVIGTAIAWRIAAKNALTADGKPTKITIVDHGDDAGRASFVAAGMLAPVSESVFGEEALLNLNLLALDRFPSFAHEIERAANQETGLRTEGTLNVAYDNGDLAALNRLAAFRRGIGLPAEFLDGRQARRLEPFLASNVTGGLLAQGDLSVDNRRYTSAVRAAAASAGVETVTGDVTRINAGVGGGGSTVTLADGEVITATSIVLAAGHAARRVGGVPDPVRKALRPVKGQILRLRHPGNLPPIITHTVRALVQGREVYLVPRKDGEVVVGATQEERDDRDITAGAVHDLLRDAMTVLPAVSELILDEISVGLRPGSIDNGPIVGRAGGGLIVAAGHFRNGILLSAATADAVASLLAGQAPAPQWAPFTPERLS